MGLLLSVLPKVSSSDKFLINETYLLFFVASSNIDIMFISYTRARKLWGSLKSKIVDDEHVTSVTDVLTAMGAVPSGFRMSTLCRRLNEGVCYKCCLNQETHSKLRYVSCFFNEGYYFFNLIGITVHILKMKRQYTREGKFK